MKKVKDQEKELPKKLTISEVKENLKLQINQHQTMLIKAQGALEVLEQLEEI